MVDWLSLIAAVLQPMFLKCHSQTSVEDPQTVLRSAYDPSSGKMDPELVNDAIPTTRRAIRRARRSASPEDRKNFPRYSRAELYDIAESNLIQAMNATPERIEEISKIAAALPDDDE